MITPNPIVGTGLHAIGGISASSCYLPFHKTKRWSWGTFWLVQTLFAWFIVPVIIGIITVPDLFTILRDAPSSAFWGAFLLGAVYGFGSMSFGVSIRHIGYSLTYTLSIGISSILGTIFPLLIFGGLSDYFSRPGGNIVLTGMVLSVMGVALCGWAGFKKERDMRVGGEKSMEFHMLTGFILSVIAGVLSAVFNISLAYGQPIADMAALHGAGHFVENAKLVVSTAGCCLVNLIWFIVAGIRQKTLSEFVPGDGLSRRLISRNLLWSALAGTMWFLQFFFYGLGDVEMGHFRFASWALHMSMLIFFSYIVGVIMKEWKNVRKHTYLTLLLALFILIASFVIIAYGSFLGETMMGK